jgi:hypothetical protein
MVYRAELAEYVQVGNAEKSFYVGDERVLRYFGGARWSAALLEIAPFIVNATVPIMDRSARIRGFVQSPVEVRLWTAVEG